MVEQMRNWRNRPMSISHVNCDIPWLIAIDESGSSDLSYSQHFISPDSTNYDKHNVHCFTYSGTN